jgi:hypothetical protein
MGTEGFFNGGKAVEADHSPPTIAEVKDMWIYLYIHSLTRLHGVVLN